MQVLCELYVYEFDHMVQRGRRCHESDEENEKTYTALPVGVEEIQKGRGYHDSDEKNEKTYRHTARRIGAEGINFPSLGLKQEDAAKGCVSHGLTDETRSLWQMQE
jgi:hypothetical protein